MMDIKIHNFYENTVIDSASLNDAQSKWKNGSLEVVYTDKVLDAAEMDLQVSFESPPPLEFVSFTLPSDYTWKMAMAVHLSQRGFGPNGKLTTPLHIIGTGGVQKANGFVPLVPYMLLLRDDSGINYNNNTVFGGSANQHGRDIDVASVEAMPIAETGGGTCPSKSSNMYSDKVESVSCINGKDTLGIFTGSGTPPACIDTTESQNNGFAIGCMYPLYPREIDAVSRCTDGETVIIDAVPPHAISTQDAPPAFSGLNLYGCRGPRKDGRRRYYSGLFDMSECYQCDESNTRSQVDKYCLDHNFKEVNKAFLKGHRTHFVLMTQANICLSTQRRLG